MTDRKAETRRARVLYLLRDERDREIEAEGRRWAGAAALLVSQGLAALCVLQEDPAWSVLLSLSFLTGAVRSFHRLLRDRAWFWLLPGLAAAGATAALWGWYWTRGTGDGLTLGRLAALLAFFAVMNGLAALLFLGLTLGAFRLKYRICRMDGEKWTAYFAGLSLPALLARLGVLLGLALAGAAALCWGILRWRGVPGAGRLAAVFLAMSGARLVRRLSARREALVEKLLRLHPAAGEKRREA